MLFWVGAGAIRRAPLSRSPLLEDMMNEKPVARVNTPILIEKERMRSERETGQAQCRRCKVIVPDLQDRGTVKVPHTVLAREKRRECARATVRNSNCVLVAYMRRWWLW